MEEQRECVTHLKNVFDSFEQMKKGEKYCDFTLVIGDEEIPVHRMVLAATSKYFDAMFSLDLNETKTGRAEIQGIEPSVGKKCIEYAYTGKIKFSRQNPQALIHAAEMMQMYDLLDLYFNFLVENISAKNCLEYMELARSYNQGSFVKIFEKFLSENFAKVIEQEDFDVISKELFIQCLNSLVDGEHNSEKLKWKAIRKRVNADLENWKDSFPELFSLINLKSLPTTFIKDEVLREPLVKNSSDIKDLILDRSLCTTDQLAEDTPRVPKETPTHILAYHKQSRLVHKYDLHTEKWFRWMRISKDFASDGADIMSLGGDIYIGTGRVVSRYRDKAWTELFKSRNNYYAEYCRLAVSLPFIYMVSRDYVATCDTRTDACQETAASCGLGAGFAIAVSSDCLYAIGGSGSEEKAMEFDLTSKTWEPISNMGYKRIDGAAVFFQGKLFALGGYYQNEISSRNKNQISSQYIKEISSRVEWYKPSVDKWVSLTVPRSGGENSCSRSNFKAFVMRNELYTVESGSNEIKKVKLSGYDNSEARTVVVESGLLCTACFKQ